MALPKQLRNEDAELAALEAQIYGVQPDAAQESADQAPESAPQDAAQEPVQSDTPQSTTETESPQAAQPEADSEEDLFQRRYATLRGKYDSETKRYRQTIAELNARISELTVENANLAQAQAVPLVTDADRAEFGEELLAVQQRIAESVNATSQAKIEALNKRIEELNQRRQDEQVQLATKGFHEKLTALVPDFSVLDADPRWIAWLDQHDTTLGGTRRGFAAAAFQNQDAEAVAYYVNLFRKTLHQQEAKKQQTRAELEKQVTPTRSATAGVPASAASAQTRYTEAEMNAKWAEVSKLYAKGDDAEAEKLERDLSAAYLEGRVTK